MKQQIKRLSPHQNGKVFGILIAVATLPIFIPVMLLMNFATPQYDMHGNEITFPFFMFLIFPFIYLVFGYISVVICCFFYNLIYRVIGGFEFETISVQSQETDQEY